MKNLPKQYAWLASEPGPLMLTASLAMLGTIEAAGTANSPTIMAWAKEAGQDVAQVYLADAIPWCGLDMAVVAIRGKKHPVKAPLWALSWAGFGVYSPTPGLGDVLIFVRKGGGHVGLYVGEDKTHYHVLGGNQGDAHNISRIPKAGLYTCRRAHYVNTPSNVRPIQLAATGLVATSLA